MITQKKDLININSTLSDFMFDQKEYLVFFLDGDLIIKQANQQFCAVIGYQPEALLHTNLDNIVQDTAVQDTVIQKNDTQPNKIQQDTTKNTELHDSYMLRNKISRLLVNHTSFSQVLDLYTSDKQKTSFLFSFHAIQISEKETQILCVANTHQDINSIRSVEEIIYKLTYTDHLTGLGNRPLFIKRLQELMVQVNNKELPCFFVASIDFDDFKKIDDLYGYKIGDELINTVAHSISAISGQSEFVFRISGNKLALLRPADTINDVDAWSQSILKVATQTYHIANHAIDVQASMGVLCVPQDAANSVEAMNCVEQAYYKAREEKNYSSVVLYYPELGEQTFRIVSIEKELKKALIYDQIDVFYQPQFSLPEHTLYGFEALVRWRHPEKGLILPGDFISIAEQTGLIIRLGNRVLEKACKQSVLWSQKGYHPIISVNISIIQLADSNFLNYVTDILHSTKVDTQFLQFEITENIFISNFQQIIIVLNHLKELGISLALDDFGTGYSSLSYIKDIPLDVLKIDRCFIQNLPTNQKDCAIVKSILTLCRELSIKVVAEGMEKEEQVRFLEQQQCNFAQGFYFSKPLDVMAADELLSKT